jgi:uncharacterized protein YjiS (DUF1127 family)
MRAEDIEKVRQRADVSPASFADNLFRGYIEIRAREMQSEHFADLLRRGVANIVRRIDKARVRRRDYEHLIHMSDRQLADIGLVRGGIHGAVFGNRPTLWRRVARIRSGFVAWRRKRDTYLELMTLDDHVLRDIGMSRSQLAFTARKRDADGGVSANLNVPRNVA